MVGEQNNENIFGQDDRELSTSSNTSFSKEETQEAQLEQAAQASEPRLRASENASTRPTVPINVEAPVRPSVSSAPSSGTETVSPAPTPVTQPAASPAGARTAASPASSASARPAVPRPSVPSHTTTAPFPRVSAQATYTSSQAQAPQARGYNPSNSASVAMKSANKKGLPSWISGFIAGLFGALLAFGILRFTGLLNPGTQASSSAASHSNQAITITPQTEDASVSEVVAAKALPSVVSIYVNSNTGAGLGSGVILDKEGNIITNYHVIEGAQSISVTMGKKSYDASVVGTDASSDLAVIHADFGDDEVVPIDKGDSDSLVVGDWVMTIGSPYGLDQSVSSGIVSSLYRSTMLPYANKRLIYTNLIQTDAAINPGNSGGALVNELGQLVGINSIVSSASGASAQVGFAIPGNYAYDVAETILAGKVVEHAQLGASVATVSTANAARYGLAATQGAYVSAVNVGSAAEEAGIKEGDIILKLGEDEIASADALILGVRSHKIGDTVDVTILRDGEEMTMQVTLGSDGGNAQASSPQSSYGGLLGDGNQGNSDEDGYYGELEELLKRLYGDQY